MIWNSVIRPAREVELLDFPNLIETTLRKDKHHLLKKRY